MFNLLEEQYSWFIDHLPKDEQAKISEIIRLLSAADPFTSRRVAEMAKELNFRDNLDDMLAYLENRKGLQGSQGLS